ncbi:MAG: HEPN domain-containing protein [Endomicrobia bacterium]|nr:HEPN domain-containing protein [Endomicrobiia bacterium]
MMPHKDILINMWIEKANTAIEDAQAAYDSKRFENSMNRIYYAIFYMVSSLAQKNDFATSKHSVLLAWFNKKFIYEDKIFDEKLFKIYSKAFSLRQESDYDVSYKLNVEKVKELLFEAKEFIKEVKEYVLLK